MPPAEAAATAVSLPVQWAIRWGPRAHSGDTGTLQLRAPPLTVNPPALHISRHWYTQVSVCFRSSFNQPPPPPDHQKQWFCLKQVLGAGQHHAVREFMRWCPTKGTLGGLSWNHVRLTPASISSVCIHRRILLALAEAGPLQSDLRGPGVICKLLALPVCALSLSSSWAPASQRKVRDEGD